MEESIFYNTFSLLAILQLLQKGQDLFMRETLRYWQRRDHHQSQKIVGIKAFWDSWKGLHKMLQTRLLVSINFAEWPTDVCNCLHTHLETLLHPASYRRVSRLLNMTTTAFSLLWWAYCTRKSENLFTMSWYFLLSEQWFCKDTT